MPALETWSPSELLRRRKAECWPALLRQWVRAQQEPHQLTYLLQEVEDLLREQGGQKNQDLMAQIGGAVARHGQTFDHHLVRDLLRDRHVRELLANSNLEREKLVQEVRRIIEIVVGEQHGRPHRGRRNLIALLDHGWELPDKLKQKLMNQLQRNEPTEKQRDPIWRPEAAHRRRQRSVYQILQHSANLTSAQLQLLYEQLGKEAVSDTVQLIEHPAADERFIRKVLEDVREKRVEWEYLGPLLEQILEHPIAQTMPQARKLVRQEGRGHLLWDLLEIADQPGERGEIALQLFKSQPQAVLGELENDEQLAQQLRASDSAILLGRTEGPQQQKLLRVLGQHKRSKDQPDTPNAQGTSSPNR